jgi:hypothetical protein
MAYTFISICYFGLIFSDFVPLPNSAISPVWLS